MIFIYSFFIKSIVWRGQEVKNLLPIIFYQIYDKPSWIYLVLIFKKLDAFLISWTSFEYVKDILKTICFCGRRGRSPCLPWAVGLRLRHKCIIGERIMKLAWGDHFFIRILATISFCEFPISSFISAILPNLSLPVYYNMYSSMVELKTDYPNWSKLWSVSGDICDIFFSLH